MTDAKLNDFDRDMGLEAHIEQLVKERDGLVSILSTASAGLRLLQRAENAEAKLAKAVEALRKMADGSSDNSEAAAKRVLAELEGN